ncbi:TPA: branched-chain amino acid ABC transporter permease, partial [Candidatus Micrarchaeota archaeon]|nr:branched-chain amino acid ABC transporter permease [Candidatus Micrarchaeota archaeon]
MALPLDLPFFVDLFAIYAIMLVVTLSLNLEFGYAGVPNFGKVLAVAGGAYVVGYLPGRLAMSLLNVGAGMEYTEQSWKIVSEINSILANDPALSLSLFGLTLIIAALAGAALGYIASYPAMRLREDYPAMTLLAMGEGIRIIGENYTPLVGGQLPVAVPDPFRWVGDRYLAVTVVLAVFAILTLAYLELLLRSPLGRTLRAMRDSEDAARALGKDVVKLRMKVLVVGSAIGAIGGALHAFYVVSVYSSAYERVTWTFWPWAMVVLGGAAN